ncbi:hypothetical protein LCGC14_3025370, partial [marine sediment metagenome]
YRKGHGHDLLQLDEHNGRGHQADREQRRFWYQTKCFSTATVLDMIARNQQRLPVDVAANAGGVLYMSDITRKWTAKGYGRQAMAVAAVASLIVRPTTLAIISLYNNTDRNFHMEQGFAHNLVSIANGQFGIWLMSHPVGSIATDTPDEDITVMDVTNGGLPLTEGQFDIEAAVVDTGWFPWGESSTSVTTTVPGSLAQAHINGEIIVPPTAGISMSCVGQTAVVTVACGFQWYSVPVDEAVNG